MSKAYEYIIDAFGLRNLNARELKRDYVLQPELASSNNNQYPAVKASPRKTLGYTSLLGTPVFSNLEIPDVTWAGKILKGLKRTDGSAIDAVLYAVSQQKHIVKTAIQGRNGTIKEYIADGDFAINIKGVLVSKDQAYPENQVQRLMNICKLPLDIKVNSWYLQQFGIYRIVIESYNFPQKAGYENMQPFELNCVSERPVETLKNEEQ